MVKIFKNVLNQENSTLSLIFLRVPNKLTSMKIEVVFK